jgi:tyrosyl-tRNA synthetase
LFGQGDLRTLDEATLRAVMAEAPSTVVPGTAALSAVSELMAEVGIVTSKSAARRLIAEGGAYLNNEKVTDPDQIPAPSDLLQGKFLVLRRGKRTTGVVEVGARGPSEVRSSI